MAKFDILMFSKFSGVDKKKLQKIYERMIKDIRLIWISEPFLNINALSKTRRKFCNKNMNFLANPSLMK